jgi:hypothetical protein
VGWVIGRISPFWWPRGACTSTQNIVHCVLGSVWVRPPLSLACCCLHQSDMVDWMVFFALLSACSHSATVKRCA